MRVQDLEPALLLTLVRFLIGIELLGERRLVKVLVGHGGVLEDNGHAIIPAAIFCRVIARGDCAYLQRQFSASMRDAV